MIYLSVFIEAHQKLFKGIHAGICRVFLEEHFFNFLRHPVDDETKCGESSITQHATDGYQKQQNRNPTRSITWLTGASKHRISKKWPRENKVLKKEEINGKKTQLDKQNRESLNQTQ